MMTTDLYDIGCSQWLAIIDVGNHQDYVRQMNRFHSLNETRRNKSTDRFELGQKRKRFVRNSDGRGAYKHDQRRTCLIHQHEPSRFSELVKDTSLVL